MFSIVMTDALYWITFREFLKSLALFSKPLVAGVHGAAVGLGVTMLPFFDMVFASDKATFYTPYAKLGQVPEGAAILTLPHMLGNAVVSTALVADCSLLSLPLSENFVHAFCIPLSTLALSDHVCLG
jgi:enoyl-CoA hydratase/carnithine racemase